MKKFITLFCLIIIFYLIIKSYLTQNYSIFSDECDFRYSNWGISKEEVKKNESNIFISWSENNDDPDRILCYTTILYKECLIAFNFKNDKLIYASYLISNITEDEEIKIYSFLRDILLARYKHIPPYTDSRYYYETPRSIISLSITPSVINHVIITYADKEYAPYVFDPDFKN